MNLRLFNSIISNPFFDWLLRYHNNNVAVDAEVILGLVVGFHVGRLHALTKVLRERMYA